MNRLINTSHIRRNKLSRKFYYLRMDSIVFPCRKMGRRVRADGTTMHLFVEHFQRSFNEEEWMLPAGSESWYPSDQVTKMLQQNDDPNKLYVYVEFQEPINDYKGFITTLDQLR